MASLEKKKGTSFSFLVLDKLDGNYYHFCLFLNNLLLWKVTKRRSGEIVSLAVIFRSRWKEKLLLLLSSLLSIKSHLLTRLVLAKQ